MKSIYLFIFAVYGTIGIYDVSIHEYTWASMWFLLSIMMIVFYIEEIIKEKK